jgi:hypothetical protein
LIVMVSFCMWGGSWVDRLKEKRSTARWWRKAGGVRQAVGGRRGAAGEALQAVADATKQPTPQRQAHAAHPRPRRAAAARAGRRCRCGG